MLAQGDLGCVHHYIAATTLRPLLRSPAGSRRLPGSSKPRAQLAHSEDAEATALHADGNADADGGSAPTTPLLDAVLKRGQQGTDVPFHVPGHKRGRGISSKAKQVLGSGNALSYDLTEIAGLDYLSSPSGVIAEAQALAARTFGASRTWFLVNGCSVGIHAAVMAVAGPGDTLLIARNCHQSAFAAMTIAGCTPYWLYPEVDQQYDVAHGITPQTMRRALSEAQAAGRRVTGALVVSPTYYGAVSHIAELAAICHKAGIPLLVDEAHGGHLGLLPPSRPPPSSFSSSNTSSVATQDHINTHSPTRHGSLTQQPPVPAGQPFETHHVNDGPTHNKPHVQQRLQQGGGTCFNTLSALHQGADVVIQSTHKTLSAMTQAAMLHVQGSRVDGDKVSRALQVLQTSSPSYLLMASLDAARAYAEDGEACFGPALKAAQSAREGLSRIPGISLMDLSHTGSLAPAPQVSPALPQAMQQLAQQGSGATSQQPQQQQQHQHQQQGEGVPAPAWKAFAMQETQAGSHEPERQAPSQHLRSVAGWDPLRVVVGVEGLGGLSGFQVAERLEKEHHIVPELATHKVIVFVLGPGSVPEDAQALVAAFTALAAEQHEPQAEVATGAEHHQTAMPTTKLGHTGAVHEALLDSVGGQPVQQGGGHYQQQPVALASPRDAFFKPTKRVRSHEAVGQASAELLCPYPPGVPLVFPGELVTQEAINALRAAKAAGGYVTGASDPTLETLLILAS